MGLKSQKIWDDPITLINIFLKLIIGISLKKSKTDNC